MSRKSVICLEFNELTPALLEQFMAAGHLPNFQRLKEQSVTGITDAQAEGEWLNPWVQWVTVHSGLDAADHEVYRLANAYKLKTPAIWDLVSAAGRKVWVCGSMNPWSCEELNGYILPDPWAHQFNPFPDSEFTAYDTFVRKNVQEYAAKKSPVTLADRKKFVSYMLKHGLKFSTILKIVRQLLSEFVRNSRWKRASILDALQCDLFEAYYREHRPDFATFFSNTVAHYQHKYWRNMRPEEFLIRPTGAEQRTFKNAIRFGYQQADQIVGRIMEMAPEATIMLISGLSQQVFHERDCEGGVRHYRLHNKDVLTHQLKISGDFSYEPIMADEFFLRFVNEIDAEACVVRLESLRLPNGKRAFTAELDGSEVIGQCRARDFMPENAELTVEGSDERILFENVFYWVDSIKSGTHHPDGVLWIRQKERTSEQLQNKVPLTSIAPTILDCMNIEIPDFMPERSLFAEESQEFEESNSRPELVLV